jgi:leucyl aminopeptidase
MEFKVIKEDFNQIEAEGWVLSLYSDRIKDYIQADFPFKQALNEEIHSMLKDKRCTGKVGQVETLPTYQMMKAKRIFIAGLGNSAEITLELLRKMAAAVARTAIQTKVNSLAFPYVPVEGVTAQQWGQAIAAGIKLAAYRSKTYQKEQTDQFELKSISIVLPLTQSMEVSADGTSGQAGVALDFDQVQKGVLIGQAHAAGVALARDLVNMPANFLTPPVLADRAVEVAKRYDLEFEVLDEEEIQKREMGALWAVGKGSIHPPRLVVIKYKGAPNSSDWLALVGKGITYDTGGYSLKPKDGMEKMISDMGGSASVIGAMEIIGRLRPKTNVMMVVPTAENMISGAAFKPGDVLVSYSGKTIEMLNSDAEGRLVLADAITYAKELGATRIVDVATLTGGVITSLGTIMSGALSNDDSFYSQLEQAANVNGEKVWRFPNDPEYRQILKSSVADIKNSTGRAAHAIMAGMFIGEFIGDTPWVHLDIAGTAFVDKEHTLGPKGATGVMARTLATLAGC